MELHAHHVIDRYNENLGCLVRLTNGDDYGRGSESEAFQRASRNGGTVWKWGCTERSGITAWYQIVPCGCRRQE